MYYKYTWNTRTYSPTGRHMNLEQAIALITEAYPKFSTTEEDWNKLLIVLGMYCSAQDSDVKKLAQWWLINEGNEIFDFNRHQLDDELLSFDFYATMIHVFDWPAAKYLLRKMPTHYVPIFLEKVIPNTWEQGQQDYFKQISKRTDEWGNLPYKWLIRTYGTNGERNG